MATAHQLAQHGRGGLAAAQQLQALIAELGAVGNQVAELPELGFIPDENGPHQPALVNDALLVVAPGLVDEYDFLVVHVVRALGQADAAQVEAVDFDDVHKGAALVEAAHVAAQEPGQHGGLLFGRRRNAVERALELGNLAQGKHAGVGGLQVGIHHHAALAGQAALAG